VPAEVAAHDGAEGVVAEHGRRPRMILAQHVEEAPEVHARIDREARVRRQLVRADEQRREARRDRPSGLVARIRREVAPEGALQLTQSGRGHRAPRLRRARAFRLGEQAGSSGTSVVPLDERRDRAEAGDGVTVEIPHRVRHGMVMRVEQIRAVVLVPARWNWPMRAGGSAST
jgi:hypothetical protein